MQINQSTLLALPKRLGPAFLTSLFFLTFVILAFWSGLLPRPLKAEGRFKIHEVRKNVSPIQTTFVYQGTLEGLPCSIYLPLKQNRPLANTDYFFSKGTLRKRSTGQYIFKPQCTWEPIKNSWSLAEWRFQTKEIVKRHLYKRFKNPKVASLLSGLATGHFENPLLSYQFGAVGLAHLLAISGFHFALLSFFLASLFKRFLPEKILALTLILLLGTYFFYMGGGPSISRAWIGVLLYLIGTLFGYRTTPLNALGVALLFALTDPFVITKVGFQLSFAATLGIILFYRPFEEKLTAFLPKRPYLVLLEMHLKDQIGYLLCSYLRKGLALQGSVLVFTLPLIVFHFQTFPLISLFYNLFVPVLFALLLALFLLHLDFLTTPLASFLITLVEGTPRRLLFQVDTMQLCIILGTILPFVYGRVLRHKKYISAQRSSSRKYLRLVVKLKRLVSYFPLNCLRNK